MAARTNRTKLDDKWKEKIKAGVILDRLHKHVMDELEMTQSQINAAKILLNKVYPDLKAVDVTGEVDHRINTIEVVRKE